MGEVKDLKSSVKAGGGPSIDVGSSAVQGVELKVFHADGKVFLQVPHANLVLGFNVMDCKAIEATLREHREQMEQDDPGQKTGLIREMPPVKLQVPKIRRNTGGPVFNPQTGRYE